MTGNVSYNAGWTEKDEVELYEFLDQCTLNGTRWMLSNATENNGKRNEILIKWLKNHRREYEVYQTNTTQVPQ